MIDASLPAEIGPLSWLIGLWQGTGVFSYSADKDNKNNPWSANLDIEFGQRVHFECPGGKSYFLRYTSYSWSLKDNSPLETESGYFRLTGVRVEPPLHFPGDLHNSSAKTAAATVEDINKLKTKYGFEVEANISQPSGISELYVGYVNGPRIEIATDAVMRSASSPNYASAKRLYGLVDSRLCWAIDASVYNNPLVSVASGVLERVKS